MNESKILAIAAAIAVILLSAGFAWHLAHPVPAFIPIVPKTFK